MGGNIINEKGDPFEFKNEGSLEVPVNLGYATAASIATGALVSTAASLAIKESTGQNTITLSCNETDVNTLLVRGQSRFGSIFVNQTSQIGDLTVSKPAIFSSDLNVKGTSNVQDLNVSGDENVQGSLNVAQQAVIGSLIVNGNTNLAIQGNTKLFTLNVTGDSNYQSAQFNDEVLMLKILRCNSDLEVYGNTSLFGPLICPGSVTIQNSQQATSDGAALYCNGGAIINRDAYLSVNGDIYCKPQQPKQVFASPTKDVGTPVFRPLIMADLPLLSVTIPIFSTGEPLPLVLNAGNVTFTCAYHYISPPAQPNNTITSISDTFSSIRPPHSCYTVNAFTQALLNVAYGKNISVAKNNIPPNQWVRFSYTDTINGVFIGKWSPYYL